MFGSHHHELDNSDVNETAIPAEKCHLLGEAGNESGNRQPVLHSKQFIQLAWLAALFNIILFVISMLVLAFSRSETLYSQSQDARYLTNLNADYKSTSAYCMYQAPAVDSIVSYIRNLRLFPAPILDALNLGPNPHKIDGAINDSTSIYRQDPSPKVDAAWDALSTEGLEIITLSGAELLRADFDPNTSVRAPSSWGRGADAYLAQIDVFHQIHCLNELRKEIHFDYYYGARFRGQPPPPQHMTHKKHCLHVLLQNLMCHADVDVIAHHWVHYRERPSRPAAEPLADFSIVKQCRDFDSLLAWARANAVTDLGRKWRELRAPDGAIVFDGTGGYFG